MRVTRITGKPDHVGVFTEFGLVDVTAAASARGNTDLVWSAYSEWNRLLEAIHDFITNEGEPIPESAASVPLSRSAKLICIGLNYRQHALESGADLPSTPVVFSKLSNTPCVSNTPVILPPVAREYDYEVELGVVIGSPIRQEVKSERALEKVFGYITANDLSARDLQGLSTQWLLGKSLDGFLPLTPWITTFDDVDEPDALDLKTWVNGELRQNSNTSDMIFGTAEIISFLSRFMTLEPGDLILTGTPSGVVLGMNEPRPWLMPGDIVEVEVEGLGRVVSPLVSPNREPPM